MESSELRIFRTVAREGSITKAAMALGYVQSNVTARVQQLEADLGKQLFYRQRGMVLTPAGDKLLDYAERVLQLLDEAHAALNDAAEPTGRLRLGASHTIAALYLPELLAKYHKAYPKVELSLITDNSDTLLQQVRHFQLDAAFVKIPEVDDNIVSERVFEEQLVLVAAPGDSSLHEVCSQPFLMNTRGCPHREKLEEWLKSEGIHSVRYMEFDHTDAILRGVMAGLGSSFVPQSAVKDYVEDEKLRSFTLLPAYSTIQTRLVRHKDSLMTSALEKFIDLVGTSLLKAD
ncbi:LysR family transcriptional regulator [Paenibacillus glycanilyticus]|uniref:LysR family transcriptional regulator n=1 Tax=Paenibacillus glycanilyticus TaxID=126569 RepID=UPI001910C709|nr:LysR family transcriptional regulator [Paenibacillus glycanilyticus]